MKFMWYLIKKRWKTCLYWLRDFLIFIFMFAVFLLFYTAVYFSSVLQYIITAIIGIIILIGIGMALFASIDGLIKDHREYKEMKDEIR